MATLETSPEANCDRQEGRRKDKATYRGSSYRFAQKIVYVHTEPFLMLCSLCLTRPSSDTEAVTMYKLGDQSLKTNNWSI